MEDKETVKHFKRLLLKVSKITALHRHGMPSRPNLLDDLSNYQLECEKFLDNPNDREVE